MSSESLATYLTDHLAGSVGAVEMLERTIDATEGTPLARALSEILEEIRQEQQVVRELLARVGAGERPLKKAGAWLAEKAGRLKIGDTGSSALARLQVLEALALGLQGKLSLWRSLQHVAAGHPELAGIDLVGLDRQARRQHERVESLRLDAAAEAL